MYLISPIGVTDINISQKNQEKLYYEEKYKKKGLFFKFIWNTS